MSGAIQARIDEITPGSRHCPSCEAWFEADYDNCPQDGTRLITLDEEADRIGETLDGHLTLTRELGRGGMGVVYQAIDTDLGREVAIKLLAPKFSRDGAIRKRFLREAKTLCRLNHPNIVIVHGFGQSQNQDLYLVMELLAGTSLGDVLHAEGPLSAQRVVQILGQVCDGMQYAHDAGLVHRDLKPDNIHIMSGAGATGEFAKVLDFGLAKQAALGQGTALTRTGIMCGTPAYVSPEQAQSMAVTPAADVYSLGVMAYEMLTGNIPFEDATPIAVLMAHMTMDPPAMAAINPDVTVSPRIEAAVRKALQKDPKNRPQSCAAFKALLLDALKPPIGGVAAFATNPAIKVEAKGRSEPAAARPDADVGPTRAGTVMLSDLTLPPEVGPPSPSRRRWPQIAISAAIAACMVATAWWASMDQSAAYAGPVTADTSAPAPPADEPAQVASPKQIEVCSDRASPFVVTGAVVRRAERRFRPRLNGAA